MFSSVGISAKQLVQEVITSSRAWVAPAGVSVVDIEGYGARGKDATNGYSSYYEVQSTYGIKGYAAGPRELVDTRETFMVGTIPGSGYCDEPVYTPGAWGGGYDYVQICYGYDRPSSAPAQPATRGTSATGLSKTFPGSLGTTPHPQTITKFDAVAVTPSQSYNIVVPSGGSITIKYYN